MFIHWINFEQFGDLLMLIFLNLVLRFMQFKSVLVLVSTTVYIIDMLVYLNIGICNYWCHQLFFITMVNLHSFLLIVGFY